MTRVVVPATSLGGCHVSIAPQPGQQRKLLVHYAGIDCAVSGPSEDCQKDSEYCIDLGSCLECSQRLSESPSIDCLGQIGFGKRGLLEKGSFQTYPFSRDSREFRDSRDFRESPDSGK